MAANSRTTLFEQAASKNHSLARKPAKALRESFNKDRGDSNGPGPLGLTLLSEPANGTEITLIFVHGFLGGSFSTWTKFGDPLLYWPRQWLPDDPDFQTTRIYSFGYDTGKQQFRHPLDITDIAKSLLVSIHEAVSKDHGSKVRRLVQRKLRTPWIGLTCVMGRVLWCWSAIVWAAL